jgi:hypothetical protein
VTDKQWDELIESFEAMEYRENKEKDIHSSCSKHRKEQIQSVTLLGQQTAPTTPLLWASFFSIRNPHF